VILFRAFTVLFRSSLKNKFAASFYRMTKCCIRYLKSCFMVHRCLFTAGRHFLLSGFALLFSLPLLAGAVSPSLTTPVFEQLPPNDTIVDCLVDIPTPVDLPANDGMGGATFMVSPIDSLENGPIDPCTGGVLTRYWPAAVGADTTWASQRITVRADETAPMTTLDMRQDTVACELALPSAPSNPRRYDVWLNSLGVALSTNTSDNCGGAVNIINDGGGPITNGCTTRTITFTLTDGCMNTSQYLATYTTIDTIAPVLVGVPGPDTLNCTEMVPPPPMVMATDNCTADLVPSFVEASGQTANGSCSDYEFNVLRSWVVSDSCGNSTVESQVIIVRDETPPTYTAPNDITISCTDDPQDLAITGDVTNAVDDCSPTVNVTYTDQVNPGTCPDESTIIRLWRASDVCGNVSGKVQVINVADLMPPSFNVPPDLTIDCSQVDELSLTGQPTNIMDDCDPDPDVDFIDDIFPGACPNSYTIRRRWRVSDRCGQLSELVQNITVVDEQAPIFTAVPQSLTLSCGDAVTANQAFADWLSTRAGALAEDNCSEPEELEWFLYNSGTTNLPTLENYACPVNDGAVRGQDVDIIVRDECGQADTVTVSFRVLDETAPNLSGCPSDFSVATDPGQCVALVSLEPPVITDACAIGELPVSATAAANLTSQAMPGQEGEVPVDPLTLDLPLLAVRPINAAGPGSLTISLFSADAEAPEEYFLVYGEDDTLLGQTSNTAAPCGDGQTVLSLSVAQLNAWSTDGIITIRLEPNIPASQPGRFAINANCPNTSSVQLDLRFDQRSLGDVVYEYRIDDGPRQSVAPIAAQDVTLDQGSHLIRYYATDCAGNVDSCSYSVMVIDQEAPELQCPLPVVVEVAADSCGRTVTLPLPTGATDNCAVFGAYTRTLPATNEAAQLDFYLDPNLNDFLPLGRTLIFDDVAANVFDDVTLTVDFQGDFNTNGAFFRVLGDDGNIVLQSTVGAADCSTPGQLVTTISAATFNSWAADGVVNLQIVPNDITVPPGVLGDGINPCDPMAVTADGDSDGISFIQATLSYGNLSLDYYTTGVTPLPRRAVPSPGGQVTETFAVGQTEVFYLMQDQAGNPDTCSFTLTVEDNTPPIVRCQPTNLFINPSGLQVEVVDATDVDNGSTDNCQIDSLWLQPNVFTCDQIGQIVNVTLSARDASGNIGTCQTIVGIAADGPQPTANSGLCGGDTLFLVANPPGDNPNLYLYQWFGPDGMALTPQQNEPDLALPGIDANDEGPYRVVITGLSGCSTDGVVNVNIEALPLTPSLATAPSVCATEDILLETPLVPSGMGVQFYWYQGTAPNGVLLGTSTEPLFTVAGPHPTGSQSFYLQVEANGCLSAPSELRSVRIFNRPVATVTYRDTLVCAGEIITLGVQPQNGATYSWTGPNSFAATQQFPTTPVLAAVNGGYYTVRASRGLCTSLPDSTLVNIKPRPGQPVLATNTPLCEGEDLVLSTTFAGASSYRWESPGGDVRTTTMPVLTIAEANQDFAGQWALEVVLNGCVSPESALVPAIIYPSPTASAAINPSPACQGDEVVLSGFSNVAGSSFRWSGPNDYRSTVQQPTLPNVGPSRAGDYELLVTTTQGCQDSITEALVILEDVNVTGISDNVPACIEAGFDAVLTASVAPVDDGSYRYRWTFNGMEISTATDLTIPNVTPEDAGTYILEVLTGDGCSSGTVPFTLDLNFLPDQPMIPATVSGQTSFCAGESLTLITSAITGADVQYYWETPAGTLTTTENTFTIGDLDTGDSGNYRVYVVRNGCASTTSPARNIVVNPIPQLSLTSNSPVCTGDLIQLQTTFFPTATYNWSGPGGFSASVHNPAIPNADQALHAGTYRVFVENLGCFSDTVSTELSVRPRPFAPLVRHDAPICLDDPDAVLTLRVDSATALPGATYQWFTDQGMIAVGDPTAELLLELIDFAAFAGGGAFDFGVRATQNGCTSSLSDPTFVQFDTIPANRAFAGMDTTVCSGQALLMAEAPTVGSGRWALVSAVDPADFSITNPDAATTTVNGLSTAGAPYVLAWTLSNGACRNYDQDQIELNVINAEEADAGDDILACADEEINLGAVPVSMDATGFWTQDTTQRALGVRISDSSNPSTGITGLVADNVYFFTWVVESVCGTTEATILVNLSDPDINAGPDVIVCSDLNEGQLEAEPPTFGSVARWRALNPDLQISDPLSATPTVRNLAVGENILIWEVDEGFCGDLSRDTAVIFYKLPPVLLDDVVSVPFGGSATFEPLLNDVVPVGTSVRIDQEPRDGMAAVLAGNTIEYVAPTNFVGVEDFTYTVVSEGCAEATATVEIVTGEGAPCKPPSIFTPNGDNINDNFVVPCLLDQRAVYPE
jgi:hypothetical protein